jgi:hypothetical protein
VKQLTSGIRPQLQTIVDEQKVAPIEVMSGLIKQHFDFSTHFIALRDDPDISDSISTFLAFYCPNIHIPNSSHLHFSTSCKEYFRQFLHSVTKTKSLHNE